jgi:Xaa-Pro aminopeptidase
MPIPNHVPGRAAITRGLATAAFLFLAIPSLSQEREPLEVYQARRQALQTKLSDGLIVLYGTRENEGSEAYHLFHQENHFYYLTGYGQPGAALLLAPGIANRKAARLDEAPLPARDTLFLPARDPKQEQWTGPRPDPNDPDMAARTGFTAVRSADELPKKLESLIRQYHVIYTLLPSPHGSEIESFVEREDVERLKKIAPAAEIRDLRRAVDSLRQVKSEGEVKRIERAVGCTMEGLQAAARELRPELYEYEIAALIKYTFERNGCRGLAFDPIVGSGIRSTILHYTENSARMEAGDLVVTDVGAEYSQYASDVTRTFPVNGHFTPRQREIYEVVLGAQKAALAAIKPGMKITGHSPDSLFQIAYQYINTHGKDLHGQPLGKYFIHGLSHHVGLDVHDPGDPARPLEPGMIITVEPGIYIPEEKIGVRIEDMALVTKDGYVLLTAKLPRDADEIERWLQK